MRRTSAWLTAAAIGLTLAGPALAADAPATAGGTGVPAKTAAAKITRTRHTHPTTKTVTKHDQKK
jgi:hypothetical protein